MVSTSVICVYNNKEQLENQLLKSLSIQDIDYELVLLDNTLQQFKSAAEALNAGAEKAKGEILIFSHQDIVLKEKNGLRQFANAIATTESGDIVGSQGVKDKCKTYYENLTCGIDFNSMLIHQYPLDLIPVSCVDEGFFGMKRTTWCRHPFDEQVCNGWDLYCVEQCLYARKMGYKVYVYPVEIHHFSRGKITIHYMKCLKSLCKLYRKDFKFIWTTCYKVRTSFLYIDMLMFLWVTNRTIRRKALS